MSPRRILVILLLNIAGIALFLSCYLPEHHGVWFAVDRAIFFYFNNQLALSPTFLRLVALTNNRAFDGCALIAMGGLYLRFYLRAAPPERRRLWIIGFVMLLTAVALNQAGHLLPVRHASPSLSFPHVNRVGELTGIPTKDASLDSFPGDHGMMLMIFAAFIWRYFGRLPFMLGAFITVAFSLPRLMIGAHWFTDIAVGSLSVTLVGLSWWLLTPASDWLIDLLNRRLPGKYRPPARRP